MMLADSNICKILDSFSGTLTNKVSPAPICPLCPPDFVLTLQNKVAIWSAKTCSVNNQVVNVCLSLLSHQSAQKPEWEVKGGQWSHLFPIKNGNVRKCLEGSNKSSLLL